MMSYDIMPHMWYLKYKQIHKVLFLNLFLFEIWATFSLSKNQGNSINENDRRRGSGRWLQ